MNCFEEMAELRGIDARKTTLPPLWWPLVFCEDRRLHRHGERGDRCEVCRAVEPLEEHHIVPKSRGRVFLLDGTEVELPTITLCGFGNHGALIGYPLCHGLAHHERLHFRCGCDGMLEFLVTAEPVKYQEALAMEGWRGL